ncbi:MAG: hypothetical protein LPK45_05780 [Bacteroidota bacterium]|nr:hypothetical protein [Bacteroidota bacterium]MDX5430578.1 hypothetical protein [Bacteroidota bacterium]MDX5469330.1 hypothetical protein [Bacteroidota bacterium]
MDIKEHMKTEGNKNWEKMLRSHLGQDSDRFPLEEGSMARIKANILAQTVQSAPLDKKKSYTWTWNIVGVAAAASLALFLVFRNTGSGPEKIDETLLSEAAETLYEQTVEEEPILEIEAEEIPQLQNTAEVQRMQEEVVYEELVAAQEKPFEKDPLASLQADEIEEFLIENLTLYSEL